MNIINTRNRVDPLIVATFPNNSFYFIHKKVSGHGTARIFMSA